jgi:hypothetical protein
MRALTRFALCPVAVIILAIGCTSEQGIIDPPKGGDPVELTTASERFSDWSPPVNLGAPVNSPFVENTAEISKDGLSLYFGSNRPGGVNRPDGMPSQDIWVSQRPSLDAPWRTPVNIGALINSPFIDAGPHLSRDGHLLFFNSNRPGGIPGSFDIWVSRRVNTQDDFAWQAPVNIGTPVNSAIFDGGVSIWGPEFYFWRGTPIPSGGTNGDIYLSIKTGDTFSDPTPVAELKSVVDAHDQRPSIRFDGREIFLSSERLGGVGMEDLWGSIRQGSGQAWQSAANLGPLVNSDRRDTQPALSEDGTMLLFASDRPREGCPVPPQSACDLDLYVTTRTLEPND